MQFYRELTQVFIGLCNKSTAASRRSHKIILFGRRDESVSVSLAFGAAILKSVALAFS